MKTNKFLVMAAMALGLGVFAACSDDDIAGGTTGKENLGSTYMSISLSMPFNGVTRANETDYNSIGKWAGQDEVKAIEVYVFNAAGDREAFETFPIGKFQVLTPASDQTVMIRPLKGIKVTPGEKKVYVVVNPTTESTNHLKNHIKIVDFQPAYQGILNLTSEGSKTITPKTAADKVARVEGNKDIILMTVKEVGTVDVQDGVTESTTLNSNTNRAKVEVKRAAARVMITTATNISLEIKGDNGLTQTVEDNYVLGKISDIKYVVGQGEKNLYFQQKADFKSPAYDVLSTQSSENAAKYDYSGLWKGYTDTGISGIPVPSKDLYNQTPETALNNISNNLKTALWGEFILPTTHEEGLDQANTKYRKGNTAYVLVRAKFTPQVVVKEDGTTYENYTFPADKDFFLGKNGVFYETIKAAHDTDKKGVANQEASLYIKGKVLYYAWINPDKTSIGWLNSPVIRNNIYHIEITGFKKIGANWNPLVPSNPNNPNDPEFPTNPDPKPKNDDYEPEDPPVNPNDPLTPKETWMSVETVILPWQVHSYSVELGD
ncbi:Mfa1 family fimbria major subunit [Bacteroides pyogenes]|uniref:Mfa1 family fimbria major subunit n=1 Tax=Bacteroides pyogenes TaxID=310300 RepID=UPI000424EAC5|nr:Mfa1 family fimbria major subunit [Bacteroides pyogenes]